MPESSSVNISRVIWEWMDDKNCWHSWSWINREPGYEQGRLCSKCNHYDQFNYTVNPDLTLDENLHLVRLAAKRAIEVFGNREFADAMLAVLMPQMDAIMKERLSEDDRDRAMAVVWIMADANQMSNAIYILLKESKNGRKM